MCACAPRARQLAEMAKQANMIIVPDKPNDISGVLATAMAVGQSAQKSTAPPSP